MSLPVVVRAETTRELWGREERFVPMSNTGHSSENRGKVETSLEDFGHPRGTLVIVGVFGALFALAWLVMYLCLFLQRGAPH
jgi:hypothetical protein